MTVQSRSSCLDADRRRVVPEDELAPARRVIGEEEQAGQRIRVDVAFKPHRGAALDVQDDAVPVVEGRLDGFTAGSAGQLEEVVPVQLVQPGQALLHLAGMHPAAGDMRDVRRFTRQDRRAREIPEIGFGGYCVDIFLPALGKLAGYVELSSNGNLVA